MTLETDNLAAVEDDELNTTAPQSKPDVWKMPEPVFRRTSGKLPKAFADKVTEVIESDGDVQAHSSPEMIPPTVAAPDPKPKSPILKLVLVALALGAMIAFIVVLLTVVYFFFLRSSNGS